MHEPTRRDAPKTLATAAVVATSVHAGAQSAPAHGAAAVARFRIRTFTAGVQLQRAGELGPVESALALLRVARRRAIDSGYEVQTIRVATNPILLDASNTARDAALAQLIELDQLITQENAVASIGPIFAHGAPDDQIAAWASELVRATHSLSFSIAVATPDRGVNPDAVRAATNVIMSLSQGSPGGVGNFRFAAAANVPAGTPFFPVAYHDGAAALSVGLESANLVREAFTGAHSVAHGRDRLRALLDAELAPIEQLAQAVSTEAGVRYLGIDTSPAPGADSSIGDAIEALTHAPFGAPSTLQACAAITEAIKSVGVAACGYSGLMLPLLEDPRLASRAAEGRISVSELLLFSSVCGTGLDVVPLAGDVAPFALQGVIGDMATLAHRLRKPLSARLFPIPGKAAGDVVTFDDPLLFASTALALERSTK